MGLFSLGGSVSSSQALSNVINFNPSFNLGDNNKSDSRSRASGLATSSAQNKDEFGLTASVGILGGTGGPATSTRGNTKDGTDVQPMVTEQAKKSFINGVDKNTLIYGGIALVVSVGLYSLVKKGK